MKLLTKVKDFSPMDLDKKSHGYLSDQFIESSCALGIIHSKASIEPSQIQPASIDLRLGQKAYRIQSSFLPESQKVEEKLEDLKLYEFDLRDGGILEKGVIYLIPLLEELELPPFMSGKTNPKSSTGRLDMFTRVIIDKGHRFDEITPGYTGKMYLEVISRSFPVKVKEGLSLNQLRLFKGKPGLKDEEFKKEFKKTPILYDRCGLEIPKTDIRIDNGLFISVDLAGNENGIIAYKSKTNSAYIDLSKTDYYDPLDFWEPVRQQKKNRLILEPDKFYIMVSKEKICIPPHLLAEMIAYEPNSGELRTHYAGFFDPGFGWLGENESDQGTRAVMEVRPHDVPFMVEDNQTFCRLKFEKMVEKPSKTYGKQMNSHYHAQELALSKYFKSP